VCCVLLQVSIYLQLFVVHYCRLASIAVMCCVLLQVSIYLQLFVVHLCRLASICSCLLCVIAG